MRMYAMGESALERSLWKRSARIVALTTPRVLPFLLLGQLASVAFRLATIRTR
jgi:hypothetical protein